MRWMAAAVVAVVLLGGCAAKSGRGARIRQLQDDVPPKCKYLGVAESAERSGWDMGDDQLGAVKEIRKKVSRMGGNAFILTHGTRVTVGTTLRADVYRCP